MTTHAVPDPVVVQRQNDLFDLYNGWSGDDPDDDPEFVAEAREVMGLPPLEDDDPTLDEIQAMADEDDDETARMQLEHDELRLRGIIAERAAGHDVTPGHDELHHYWARGEGLAKWAESPKPWTTLVAHLTKHVGLRKAKIFASRWFIEHFGYAAGSDKNRVAHGRPPRGHRIGPG